MAKLRFVIGCAVLLTALACRRGAEVPPGAHETVPSDPRFDETWRQLAGSGAEVFYIEDDRGEGLMGRVRRASRTVPDPLPTRGRDAGANANDRAGQEDVSAVIRSNLPGVKFCYLKVTRTGRNVSGKAVVSFRVDTQGAVSEVSVEAPIFRDTTLPTCITEQVKRWSFPKTGPGGVAVKYPFVFVSG